MNEITIGNRKVGINHPPLVIVEIGINHGGNLDTAFLMVDAAWKSGAEVIKHQTHIIEDEMSSEAKNVIPGNASESIYEIMKKCALNEEDEIKLKNYVEEFDLDNPSDLSIKLLNYINKDESKFNEIDYQTEFNENKFKKNYEFIINDYRNLLKKWRAI